MLNVSIKDFKSCDNILFEFFFFDLPKSVVIIICIANIFP